MKTLAEDINKQFGSEGYKPVIHLDRPVPMYERMAFYSIADILILTATRDGMNLAPYEYVVCRQGAPSEDNVPKTSMLVVSGQYLICRSVSDVFPSESLLCVGD